MDLLRQFSLEVNGITGEILEYSSSPFLLNITENLKQSTNNKDIEEILFFLNQLSDWYKREMNSILVNEFVFDKQRHRENEIKINDYISKMQNMKVELDKDHSRKENNIINKKKGETKEIFISHSSKDEKICTAIVELLEGIGISEDLILYTSSPRHDVPGDESIFEYLRNHIEKGITVYYMLSDNYYESPYCLNEMGAAWIRQNDYSTFLLPNFSGEIRGVIDSNKKAFRLDVANDLITFKQKLVKQFKLDISDRKFEDLKNKVLDIAKKM